MAAFEYRQAQEIRDVFARYGVRYLFIGKSGAMNAGLFAAQILATRDPELRRRLQRHKASMADKVLEKNRTLKNAAAEDRA